MKTCTVATKEGSPARSLGSLILLALPMMVLTFLAVFRGKVPSEPVRLLATILTFLFVNTLFILMLTKKKTDRFRAILFITYAIAFVISFICHLIEERGSMALTGANMWEGNTPFCHIVIPMTLIPAALTRTIIFPGTMIGTHAAVSSMFVLWIGASLALGRGFCGWGCFFGGLEDGFSRLLRKPLVRHINPVWTYLPYAVLLVVVLTAAITLSPTYCTWLCPFKTTTEYVAITSVKVVIQTIIFLSLFVGLVVLLPVLTRRRTQCGLFCPFGAFQSFTNKVNAFDIRIDGGKCIHCGLCVQACPTFSLRKEDVEKGRAGITCMKCGKCVDICPRGAITYHIKGTPPGGAAERYRLFFLYPAFLFLTTMAGVSLTDAIVRIVKLLTTGTMI
jgi:ferredoxin-type protein NapH